MEATGSAPHSTATAPEPRVLSSGGKILYALGDHTVNLSLSALGIIFFAFLSETAGLRPALVGLVIWLARFVDGISDPLMGRISDRTRSRFGRRRPYFLLGALPFGVFFMLLWATPFEGQASMFAYYLAVYIGLSLAMTVCSVPYMALIPEMATDYDERTSLNTYRAGFAVLGTGAAVGMAALADALGGGAVGHFQAGALIALWIILPWPGVFAVSWERPPEPHDSSPSGLRPILHAMRDALRHANYRRLCIFFISARVAVDILALSFPLFFRYVLGRESDWQLALGAMLLCVVLSLPIWLRIARRIDKHVLFIIGCGWWILLLMVLFTVTPEWPRWLLFVVCGLVGIGYAVADLMPWAMLGEVIDEDRLVSGERREGIYNGLFTFLRKLGGASAAFLSGILLELSGKEQGLAPESALLAIRSLATLIPAIFLTLAIVVAFTYPLGRIRHREILARLDALERERPSP